MLPGFSVEQLSGKLVVTEVLPASPAEGSGMKVGVELISLNGVRVPLCRNEASAWQSASADHSVVVRRGRKMLEFDVSPVRLSALLRRSIPPQVQSVSLGGGNSRLPRWSPFLSGLVVSLMNKAAKVTYVLPGSSADAEGIRAGDVILTASGLTPTDIDQLEGADYRSDLILRVATSSGERTMRLTMTSVTEILEVLAHGTANTRARSEGF